MEAYRAAPPSPTSLGVPMLDDMFKAWNTAFAGDPCQHALLAQMPSRRLSLVNSPDGSDRPIYRYMPNATTPVGLVTNEIGWRGPPLRHKKPATVRIVFVGASTTAEYMTCAIFLPRAARPPAGLLGRPLIELTSTSRR